MDFIDEALDNNPDQLWVVHVSYIKPHWPYIVPDPYASMYGPDDIPLAFRQLKALYRRMFIPRKMSTFRCNRGSISAKNMGSWLTQK